jgi:L-lactate dehydrogenase complex protein LldF
MLRSPREYAGNVSACSLCYSCNNVCPAKIDLADQIYRWRQELDRDGVANPTKKLMSAGMKYLFARPTRYNTALKLAPIVNNLPRFLIYNGLNDWGKGRELPAFAKRSFTEMWKRGEVQKALKKENKENKEDKEYKENKEDTTNKKGEAK